MGEENEYLKVKIFDFENSVIPIIILNKDYIFKKGLNILDKVMVRHGKKETLCVINESKSFIKYDEVGVYNRIAKELKLSEDSKLEISSAKKPESIEFIKKKIEGGKLNNFEIDLIVKDIVNKHFSDAELAFFVSGVYHNGLNFEEIKNLSKSMTLNGDKIDFGKEITFDKHCIGGVPNNRTTLIIIPLISALGFKMAKFSSKAITSPAGTADVMGAISNIELSIKKVVEQVKKIGACISWGGKFNIAGADDELIRVRKSLSLDPDSLIISSILSKKKAAGSKVLLIDIPWGRGSKIESKARAISLKKSFEKLGNSLGIKTRAVLTDGTKPIGDGVGPVLEVLDIIKILKREGGPKDLEEKSLMLCYELLKAGNYSTSINKLKLFLDSKKPWEQFKKIVKAQKGSLNNLKTSKICFDVSSKKSGLIKRIDNKNLVKITRRVGAPKDLQAGIFLHKKVGELVKKGECLMTIYSNHEFKLKKAIAKLEENPVFII